MKMVRFTVVIKNGLMELKRILHPRAMFPVRINRMALPENVTFNILGFFLLYITIFVFGSIVMTTLGMDWRQPSGPPPPALATWDLGSAQ